MRIRRVGSRAIKSKLDLQTALGILNILVITIGAALTAVYGLPGFLQAQRQLGLSPPVSSAESGVLRVRDVGPCANSMRNYEINYGVFAANKLNEGYQVTYSIDQVYTGKITNANPSPGHPLIINDPPTPFDKSPPGNIRWNAPIIFEDSVIDGFSAKPNQQVSDFLRRIGAPPYSEGTGLTGKYGPNSTPGHNAHFFVCALPTDYLAVVIAFGINDATTSPSDELGVNSEMLPLDAVGHSPQGVSVAGGMVHEEPSSRKV